MWVVHGAPSSGASPLHTDRECRPGDLGRSRGSRVQPWDRSRGRTRNRKIARVAGLETRGRPSPPPPVSESTTLTQTTTTPPPDDSGRRHGGPDGSAGGLLGQTAGDRPTANDF